MKTRIALATIAACMALAACGGSNDEANTLTADDNLMTDMNAGMTDMNATTDMNGMDMNATTNTDTTNTTNTL